MCSPIKSRKSTLTILIVGCLLSVTCFSSKAQLQQHNYVLVEGKQNTGLWLSANVDKGSPVADPLVQGAIAANSKLLGAKGKSIPQDVISEPLASVDIAKTPALLPLDAKSADYQSYWRWGNNVLLDVNYVLDTRQLPWRSDFECSQSADCKLLIRPKPQFFELSYFQIKQHKNKQVAETKLNAKATGTHKYTLNWQSPKSKPDFAGKLSQEFGLQWHLIIQAEKGTLSRDTNGQFVSAKGSSVTKQLAAALNQPIKAEMLDQKLHSQQAGSYDSPLDNKKFGYFARSYDAATGHQVSKRIVYQEQLVSLTQNWESVSIIGKLPLQDRTFVFIKPKMGSNAKKVSPVYVFEQKASGPIKLGVSADWLGALVSSDYLLESVRIKNS